jgi:hypothetical protein
MDSRRKKGTRRALVELAASVELSRGCGPNVESAAQPGAQSQDRLYGGGRKECQEALGGVVINLRELRALRGQVRHRSDGGLNPKSSQHSCCTGFATAFIPCFSRFEAVQGWSRGSGQNAKRIPSRQAGYPGYVQRGAIDAALPRYPPSVGRSGTRQPSSPS